MELKLIAKHTLCVIKSGCEFPVKGSETTHDFSKLSMAPRSRGYRDATAMFIRRSEIPSRIYAKHQYRQESECGSTMVIYIPIEKYKYMVITESDIILQEYCITRKYKST